METKAIWPNVRGCVSAGQSVRNWTVLKGYMGDNFEIVKVGNDHLEIESPKAENLIRVNNKDFEAVWELWPGYKNGRVPRGELTPITFYSKYVISILHWMETER